MSIRITKSRTFEQIARVFWDDLVNTILVPGGRGCAPSEGEVLSAYNDMNSRHPECECIILRKDRSSSDFFQPGDKIGGIRIIRKFDAGNSSIEFILTASTYYVRFQSNDTDSFSHKVDYCNLQQTIKNFENFIENFPRHMEKLEEIRLEHKKMLKIEKMTESSIRASLLQTLKPMGYGWNLTERGRDYLLRIFAPGTEITLTLNAKNFAKRIAALPEAIAHIENLFGKLTFPIEISMRM